MISQTIIVYLYENCTKNDQGLYSEINWTFLIVEKLILFVFHRYQYSKNICQHEIISVRRDFKQFEKKLKFVNYFLQFDLIWPWSGRSVKNPFHFRKSELYPFAFWVFITTNVWRNLLKGQSLLIGKIPNGLKVDLDGFKIIRASDSKPSERLLNGGVFTQLEKD